MTGRPEPDLVGALLAGLLAVSLDHARPALRVALELLAGVLR